MGYAIDLKGQVAIVTGGKAGIGGGIALKLAEAGASIAFCGSSDESKVVDMLSKLKDLGVEAIYRQVDLTIEGEGTKFVQAVVEHFGRIDIVINNAAMPTEDWHKALNINVIAPLELIQEAAKDMEKRNYGRVVNITSSSTFSGGTPLPQYNATKGALESMSRFLAKQYAPNGILINSVAPGPVLTEMIQKRYTAQEFSDHYIDQMPINRYLLPEDVAGAVLFFSSELCSAACGQTLLCDGGRVTLSVK